MKQKPHRIAAAGLAAALISLLCGCKTPVVTHNVAYDLTPLVTHASARDTMKAHEGDAAVVFVCLGSRAESNNIATVSQYHCVKPSQKEIFNKSGGPSLFLGAGMAGFIHVLQTPEPLGKYVERAASSALASKGIKESSASPKKLVLQLERFDYDETSDRKKTGPVMMPWQAFSDNDGVLRKGFMDVAVKVVQADGTTAYQRRISVEVTRKRGQASSGTLFAAVAIAQVSPIAPNPEAVREREEKTVTADVLADVFAKFQDELVADEDLLQAIRK